MSTRIIRNGGTRGGIKNSGTLRSPEPAWASFADFLSPRPNFPDLFGKLPAPKRSRGRPQHEPTDDNRSKIKHLLKLCVPKWRIAKLLGISLPTLRLYYLQPKIPEKKSQQKGHDDGQA